MKLSLLRTATILSILSLLAGCKSGGSVEPNTLTSAEQQNGWRLLFDGETVDGWRVYKTSDAPSGWVVEDGALTMMKDGGDIITVESFDNFELMLEWKIAPGGNSGILFNVIEGPAYVWESGPEMQVLDNAVLGEDDDRSVSAGACYALYEPAADVANPAGEWNQIRLLIFRGRVEHWMNGTKLCEYQLGSDDWKERVAASKFSVMPQFGKARGGHIALQDHGNRVWFRSVKIREISR